MKPQSSAHRPGARAAVPTRSLHVSTFWMFGAVVLWLPALGAPVLAAEPPGRKVASAEADTDYRIASRDLLQFKIFEEPDVETVQRVSERGEVSIPMLGTVQVAGLSLRRAEQLMQKELVDRGFFIKPQVILTVQAYAPRHVAVLGQVTRPAQVTFPIERPELGIMQAITDAGGFTRVAKLDEVRVIRTENGKERQFTVNIAQYLELKGAIAEFKLKPEDVVYVPERVF